VSGDWGSRLFVNIEAAVARGASVWQESAEGLELSKITFIKEVSRILITFLKEGVLPGGLGFTWARPVLLSQWCLAITAQW
jgi:hypothetical protein